jgi:hypothetical protein
MRAIAIAISATAAPFSVREGERSVETATKLRMSVQYRSGGWNTCGKGNCTGEKTATGVPDCD